MSLEKTFKRNFLWHQFIMFMELVKPLSSNNYSCIFIYVYFWTVYPLIRITLYFDSIVFFGWLYTLAMFVDFTNYFNCGINLFCFTFFNVYSEGCLAYLWILCNNLKSIGLTCCISMGEFSISFIFYSTNFLVTSVGWS